MSTYIFAITQAIRYFPVAALFITIPFVIYKYRKYGSIPLLYFLFVYLFIFYIMCVFSLIILPLPDRLEVAARTSKFFNLRPFDYVEDVLISTPPDLHNPNSLVAFIMNNRWLEPLFNILMLVPFGIYVRYYKRWSWHKTLRFSFYLSLFCELTQLSGLYLIYPRPYRLFDVNDLIDNTAGGMLGYLIAPLFMHFLPTRERIDRSAIINGSVAGFGRRFTAFFIDAVFVSVACGIIFAFLPFRYYSLQGIAAAIVMTAVIYLSHGSSIGKAIVNLKIVDTRTGETPALLTLFARELIVWAWFYGTLVYGSPVQAFLPDSSILPYYFVVYFVSCLVLIYDLLKSRHRDDKQFSFEERLHIANIPVLKERALKQMKPKWTGRDTVELIVTLVLAVVIYLGVPMLTGIFEIIPTLIVNPLMCAIVGYRWTRRAYPSLEMVLFVPLLYVTVILASYSQTRFFYMMFYEFMALIGAMIASIKLRRTK